MSTQRYPNNPGQETSDQPLASSTSSNANRQYENDENYARMLQAQFDAELVPPNALQPQNYPNPVQITIQEDFYIDGGASNPHSWNADQNHGKRKRESDEEVVLLHETQELNGHQCSGGPTQETSGASGQQYQAQPSTSGHPEVVPSPPQLYYESGPTSPDPVEMVRQFELDEELARVLQNDQVEQDHYVTENERVARQLQQQELWDPISAAGSQATAFMFPYQQQELQEPIHPYVSTAGSQLTNAIIIADKVTVPNVSTQGATIQRVATQSTVQNAASKVSVAQNVGLLSAAGRDTIRNAKIQVTKARTAELTDQNSIGQNFDNRNSAVQNVAKKRVKGSGMPDKTVEVTKEIAKDKESDLEIKAENSERLICKICMDQPVTVAFQPCGHVAVCQNCADPLKKCPVCRAKVTRKLKIFIT